jgi:hypothetical protein
MLVAMAADVLTGGYKDCRDEISGNTCGPVLYNNTRRMRQKSFTEPNCQGSMVAGGTEFNANSTGIKYLPAPG